MQVSWLIPKQPPCTRQATTALREEKIFPKTTGLAGLMRSTGRAPYGYFVEAATRILWEFRELAEAQRHDGLIELFPEANVADTLQNSWKDSAVRIYQNWLDYVADRKADALESVATACAGRT
jgi:hypothetical protein